MIKPLRIVFMGTPEFAVPMLSALIASQHEIVAVVTAPDKPAGRGMQMQESEIKRFASAKEIRMLQPVKLKDEHFINELKDINADLFVVVAFRMLPEIVWSMPPLGTINLHASLLPNYRGAAPINWAVINGESETGVTTFKLQHEIDTGHIIFQDKTAIQKEDNVGTVYHKLMDIGAALLLKTVNAIANGDYPLLQQDQIREIKHAPKIFKEHCAIDWSKSAVSVNNLIRGLSPYPGAFCYLNGKMLKIFSSEYVTAQNHMKNLGAFDTDGKSFLRFYCSDGYIDCKELQIEGKKRMGIVEFLRGNKIS